MNTDEIVQKVKDIYYKWEDKYYDFLDTLEDKKIPVYKVVDPIDKVFPSFMLLLILIFLFGVALFFVLLAVVFPGLLSGILGGGNIARFAVINQDAEPAPDVQVTLTFDDGTSENLVSDAFGEFSVQAKTPEALVEINDPGYVKFSERMQLVTNQIIEIVLDESSSGGQSEQKTIRIQDETGAPLNGARIRFSCSNNVTPPQTKLSANSTETILVESSCGRVSATVSLTGYLDSTRPLTGATTIFALVRDTGESIKGSLRVSVIDENSGAAIPGISLTLYNSNSVREDSAQSDGTGIHVFEAVPGSYYVRTNDPTNIYPPEESDVATIRAGQESTLVVSLHRASLGEIGKIVIEVVDAQSKAPIEGATVNLLEDGDQTTLEVTNSLGIAEFPGLGTDKNYSVTVEHEDYIFKLVPDVPVVAPSSTQKTKVELREALENNSSAVIVQVKDFAGNPISGADVQLFDSAITFAVRTGETNADGRTTFANMGPGTYHASASTLGQDGNSANGTLTTGSDLILDIVLVLEEGSIDVTVVNSSDAPIADANVTFIDSILENVLGRVLTNVQGTTTEQSFRVNLRPYLVVSKIGYLPKTTGAFTLIPNDTIDTRISLTSEEDLENEKCNGETQLCINLSETILDSQGRPVNQLAKNKEYTFSFRVTATEPLTNVKVAIMAGPRDPVISVGSLVLIKEAGTSGFSGIKYSSFNPANRFDDSLEVTMGDGKFAIVNLGNLSLGQYEFPVKIKIGDTTDTDALVELRYAGRGSIESTNILLPEEDWFLFDTELGERVPCTSHCDNFIFNSSLVSTGTPADPDYTNPVPLNTIDEFSLKEDLQYSLVFDVFNNHSDGTTFRDVTATFSNFNVADNEAVGFNPDTVSLGDLVHNLEGGVRGNTTVDTLVSDGSDKIVLSLGLDEEDDTVSYKVKVLPKKQLVIESMRTEIRSGRVVSLQVRVTDADDVSVLGATLAWANNQEFNTSHPFGSGYSVQLGPLDAGTTVYIRAQKALYRDAQVVSVPVVADDVIGEFSGQDFSCLKYEGADIDFENETIGTLSFTRGSSASQFVNFSTEDCAHDLILTFRKGVFPTYASKSIDLAPASLSLAENNGTGRLRVGAENAELSGHYDIEVSAEFDDDSSEAVLIGLIEVTVSGKVEDLFTLGKFKFNILENPPNNGLDSSAFINQKPTEVSYFIYPDVAFTAQKSRQYLLENTRLADLEPLNVEWKVVGTAIDSVVTYISIPTPVPVPPNLFNPGNESTANINWFCSSSVGTTCTKTGSFTISNIESAGVTAHLDRLWFTGTGELKINNGAPIPLTPDSGHCGESNVPSAIDLGAIKNPDDPTNFTYTVTVNPGGGGCDNNSYFGGAIRVGSNGAEVTIDTSETPVTILPGDYVRPATFPDPANGFVVSRARIEAAIGTLPPNLDNIQISVVIPDSSPAKDVFSLWLDTDTGNLETGYPIMGQYLGDSERDTSAPINFTIQNTGSKGREYDVISVTDYVSESGDTGPVTEHISFTINDEPRTAANVLLDGSEQNFGPVGDGGFGVAQRDGAYAIVVSPDSLAEVYFKNGGTDIEQISIEANPDVFISSHARLNPTNELNLAFLIDTSGSMDQEWGTVCTVIDEIKASLRAEGFNLDGDDDGTDDIAIYGMKHTRGACATGEVGWGGSVWQLQPFLFFFKHDSEDEAWGPTGISAINAFNDGVRDWDDDAKNILIIIGDNDPTGKFSLDRTANWRNDVENWDDGPRTDYPAELQTAVNLIARANEENISVFFMHPAHESMESQNVSDYEGETPYPAGNPTANDAIELMDLVAQQTQGATFNYLETDPDSFGTQRFISIVQRATTQTATQSFHIRVDAGTEDICYGRTVDGAPLIGFTGDSAVPRVLPTWDWSKIEYDTCNVFDSEGVVKNDFYYCDATQFTSSLMKRINMIKDEYEDTPDFIKIDELSTFRVWLIKDGYTSDFKNDFKTWIDSEFVSAEDDYIDDEVGLKLLFPDDLSFITITTGVDTLPNSGMYEVTIDTTFDTASNAFFSAPGVSNVNLRVIFTPLSENALGNLLYEIPLDGPVGLTGTSSSVERTGYGTGFTGTGSEALSLYEAGNDKPLEITGSTGSPIATIGTAVNRNFETVNNSLRGNLLQIREGAGTNYNLTYTPSWPNAVIMGAKNNSTATGPVNAYVLLHDGTDFVGDLEYLSVWDEFATELDNTCLNFDGLRLQKNLRDVSNSGASCDGAPGNAYGFHWNTAPQNESVYLRTVIYTPTQNYSVSNACSQNSVLLANRNTSVSNTSALELNAYAPGPEYQPISLTNIFKLIEDKYVCVSVDETTRETNFWWNQNKFYDDIVAQETVDLGFTCNFTPPA